MIDPRNINIVCSKKILIKMTLIQYIIIRKDLIKVLKWNLGAIIANSCHAVAAVSLDLIYKIEI